MDDIFVFNYFDVDPLAIEAIDLGEIEKLRPIRHSRSLKVNNFDSSGKPVRTFLLVNHSSLLCTLTVTSLQFCAVLTFVAEQLAQ